MIPLLVWLVSDLCASYFAFLIAVLLRFGSFAHAADSLGNAYLRATVFSICVVVTLLSMGLYRERGRTNPADVVSRVAVATGTASLFCIFVFYMLPYLETGRGVLAISTIVAFLLVSLLRLVLTRVIDRNPLRARLLVIGTGAAATKIGLLRRKTDQRNFRVVGYFDVDDSQSHENQTTLHPIFRRAEDLHDLDFDLAVIALDDRRDNYPLDLLLEIKRKGKRVTTLIDFLESATGRIDLDTVSADWFIFSSYGPSGQMQQIGKRLTDIFLSGVVFLISLPLVVLAAIALGVESRFQAPVMYRQERVGLDGKPFTLMKFRSMRPDAEADGQAVWWSEQDPRVTNVGKIIRRLKIDELPQLLSVIRGDMSIVGPRPERPEFVSELSSKIPMYDYRHCIKPGLTGWAQICFPYGGSVEDAREKLQYDFHYINNTNLLLDLVILAQTVEVLLWGKGLSMSGRRKHVPIDP